MFVVFGHLEILEQWGQKDTSSTSCTVAPGPPLLDTGQEMVVAKIFVGDFTMQMQFDMRFIHAFAEDRRFAQHVGIPLEQSAGQSGREVDHSPMVGQRIGEASHPGPHGGGARATARRRDEMEEDEDNVGADSPGLASMLRPMIMQLLKEVLRDLLEGDGLRTMLTGMLVGQQPVTFSSRASTVTPQADDDARAKGKGTNAGAADGDKDAKGRWRRGRDNADASDKAKGKGKKVENGGAKGKGHTKEGDPGPGDGKSTKGGRGKSDGKSKEGGPSTGGGKSKGGGSKGLGKAKDADDGGWETIPVRDWKLRDGDWSDAVLDYDALVAKASSSDDVVRAVAKVDEDQCETLLSLFRGSGKPHALLLVVARSGSDTERCPGAVAGRLTFRQVHFTRAHSPGLQPPGPKTQAAAAKVEVLRNSVVFVRFVQKYLEKDQWTQVTKNPQRVFLDLLSKLRLKALDTWGWGLEQAPGTNTQQVFGKRRLADRDIPTLLATSGQLAFFEPSRGYPMEPVTTEWVQQLDSESPAAYLKRCLAVTADFGLVHGRKQLGKRTKRDPSAPVQRLWLVQMVPKAVMAEQLAQVLGQTFDDVQMVFQERRGSTNDYTFRAKSAETADSMAIPLQVGEDNLVLWVRHAPAKRGPPPKQLIQTSGAWSLLGPRQPFACETKKGVPETVESGGDNSADVAAPPTAAAAAKEGGKPDDNKRAGSTNAPAAKRIATAQRALPSGCKVTKTDTDGNCMFSAIAKGLNKIGKGSEKEINGAEVRAKVAVHLRKNSERYLRDWDREMPDGTKGEQWESYVQEIEKNGIWGGLPELRACSRIWDIRIIVFPTQEQVEPFEIHGQQKKRVVALYFSGRHYDLLEGESGGLPKSILNIRGSPETVPLRGGGRGEDDACSRSSRRTVWIQDEDRPATSKASVWTSVAGSGGSARSRAPSRASTTSKLRLTPKTKDSSNPDPQFRAEKGGLADPLFGAQNGGLSKANFRTDNLGSGHQPAASQAAARTRAGRGESGIASSLPRSSCSERLQPAAPSGRCGREGRDQQGPALVQVESLAASAASAARLRGSSGAQCSEGLKNGAPANSRSKAGKGVDAASGASVWTSMDVDDGDLAVAGSSTPSEIVGDAS